MDSFVEKAERVTGAVYVVLDPEGKAGVIRHVIWSEILICPTCNSEISYFEYGTTRNHVRIVGRTIMLQISPLPPKNITIVY